MSTKDAFLEQYDRRTFDRIGGGVQRFHNRPGMAQSVADHSFHMALLCCRLHPDPSTMLLRAILEHDLPEALTGDVPAPAKRKSAPIAEGLEMLELEIEQTFELKAYRQLNQTERFWLRCLDSLEVLHHCIACRMVGNLHASRVFMEAYGSLEAMADLPGAILREMEWCAAKLTAVIDSRNR